MLMQTPTQTTLPGAKKEDGEIKPVIQNTNTNANGLMSITSMPQANSSPTAAATVTSTPATTQSNFKPVQYQAQNGSVNNDMLVENRVAGLMDMNSKAGKKAIVNANNYSASRGLQSSSIATENAANAMFNFALPIAQQDAKAYTDQSFLNQQKQQEAGITNTQAQNQFGLQKDQQGYQSGENAADRTFQSQLENQRFGNQSALQDDAQAFQSTFQKEIEALRFDNNKGLLGIEGQQRLEQLEKQNEYALIQMDRGAKIQSERDAILQTFQEKNINLEGAQRLAAIEAQALEAAKAQGIQNDFARSMEYSNGVSSVITAGMSSLGTALSNPEMTPAQFSIYKANIEGMVQNQINDLNDIYGIDSGEDQDQGSGNTPIINDPNTDNDELPIGPFTDGPGR